MGCASSKLDDLPAVALCRERCAFLDVAIHQRFALAEAHAAYIHSLKVVGHSLHTFFDQDLVNSSPGPPSPVLNLPRERKGDPEPSGSAPTPVVGHGHHLSHSNSGSHIQFHPDFDDVSDSDSDSLHHDGHLHSGSSSPVHPYEHISFSDYEIMDKNYPGVGGGGFLHMNYMKNQTTPSVLFEHRPMSGPTFQMGESSSSAYHPQYPYASNQNPSFQVPNQNPNPSNYGYSNYGPFLGSSPPNSYGYSSRTAPSEPSTSKPPPLPPSPPKSSPWEFLNPFDNFFDGYYPPYTPSRDLKEVREEEGIPELEDEDYQNEVVKEVHPKFVDGGDVGSRVSYSEAAKDDEDGKPSDLARASMEPDAVEYEVHIVDKEVVDNKEKPKEKGNVSGLKDRGGLRGDSDVMKEIQVQFERASESGNELAKMLEVGKLPHNRKHASYQASKMLHVITPSSMVSLRPSISQGLTMLSVDNTDPSNLNIDEVVGVGYRNLSSTLQKLYLWEKKLYEEVKAEEKMRVLHERKCRKLKRLDEKGAEAPKVDATRRLVRSLSTKIRIAIQVVDKISVKINKLRDEELWPQLSEFIQGLTHMWKAMLECHHNQCDAISQARRLDAIASRKHFSDANLEVTLQLERELLNWTLRFSCWVSSQKGYVRALNNWLMKCLLYVPEETPDGVAPFSPGRIGAPPVFVICNHWSQALESISEKEVVEHLRGFARSVLQLWDRDKLEMRQRMMVNKDTERKVKNLERDDLRIQKDIQALDKVMVLVSGDGNGLSLSGQVLNQSDHEFVGFQASLHHIFEAMERFASSSLKAYEDLLQRIIEEDKLSQENDKVS